MTKGNGSSTTRCQLSLTIYQNNNYKDDVHVQKVVAMVLYKLAYAETNPNVQNMFGLGKTTVLKYLLLICNALADKHKSYAQFIIILTHVRLKDIIHGFHRIIKLPQICSVIDGYYVKLYRKPLKKYGLSIGVDTMYIQYCYKVNHDYVVKGQYDV